MVISRGPGWVVDGATLVVVVVVVVVIVVVVVDIVTVAVVVEVSGAIEASTSTRLDETEDFEFCTSLHANKRLALSSVRRNLDCTYSITKYHNSCDQIIQRRDQGPWPTSP
jgi:hypothetical protein